MNCTCRTCLINKPIENFYFRKDRNRYSTQCKSCAISAANKNYTDNKPARLQSMHSYHELHRDEHLEISRQYYIDNKETILAQNKQWRDNFREIHGTSYNNFRYHSDIQHKLRCIIRNRLADALKADNVPLVHVSIGCTSEFLILHLEQQFKPGMTWENWTTDGWHIDHIKPLKDFDLSNIEELNAACHYTNLQPLWAIDNWYKNRATIITS